MNTENSTNWNFAASGLVIRDGKVLLVRHTYGSAKGKLLIPGGYCHVGELPEAAAIRECFEETGVHVSVVSLLAMRFSATSWYPVFIMKYESGEPVSDGIENSEASFIDIDEAINHPDLTNMTKRCLMMYKQSSEHALAHYPDYGAEKGFSLYGTDM